MQIVYTGSEFYFAHAQRKFVKVVLYQKIIGLATLTIVESFMLVSGIAQSWLLAAQLPILVSTISNSQIFLLKKYKSYSHFFSKNISIAAIFKDLSLNNMVTNDILSFEQLGHDCFLIFP